eukprot:PDM67453.1 hypothetical protein PRIPAC_48870 [Pristionchus pacificus]
MAYGGRSHSRNVGQSPFSTWNRSETSSFTPISTLPTFTRPRSGDFLVRAQPAQHDLGVAELAWRD